MRTVAGWLAICVAAAGTWRAGAAPVMAEGVPPVGWPVGEHWQRISALHSALVALGCEVSYEELLVRSGCAFGTVWVPGSYSYATIVVAPEDLVVNGAQAVGATAEHRCFPMREEALPPLFESLDQGRPVVAWDGVGACVICGYDADARKLWVQSNANKTKDYQEQPLTYFTAPDYLECPHSLVFLECDRAAPMPERDWGAILRRAVRFADWPVSKPLGPGALYGLAAYDAWADTLRMGPDEQGADADIHLHVPVTSMVAAARKAAAKALSEDASLHEAFAEAAEHYLAEVQVLEQMNTVLAGGQGGGDWNAMLKAMAENLEAGTAGEAGAQVIEQARAEEEQAVDALRRALRDLGPAGAPRADARPPEPAATAAPVAPAAKPGEAEVLYEHGVEQKRAGNLKDAVVLLRAAIAADPKLVRAHYALAWVLKDQQDIEGAAAEFRKVVELSPDSAEAQESKKALERMGQ